MPRIARQKSRSGIYHIMLRGVKRQEIFHDENDCNRFLETLNKYTDDSEIKVYGWCLMGNHVHLLLQEGIEELGITMKRIGVSYAWYYNSKYKTVGHLFQDRYRSENVESDAYLLTAIRYIHQNPVKAGMVKKPYDWKWSSCRGYYEERFYYSSLLNTSLILGLFSNDKNISIELFKEYNEKQNEDKLIDDEIKNKFSDDEAKDEIKKIIPSCEIENIRNLPKLQRDEMVRRIKMIDGLTQRQTSDILGISLSLISRA